MNLRAGKRYSSAELNELANAVVAFREKFEELLTHTVTFRAGPVGHWQVPREGHEEEVEMLTAEVSTLAGPAQAGVALSQTMITVIGDRGRPLTLNPVAAWLNVTQPKALIQPDDVLHAARVAEGQLRADARTALREEKSFAGRIAALIRLPVRVSDIAGFRRSSKAGRATQVTVGVLIAGVFASLVASALWSLIGWLIL